MCIGFDFFTADETNLFVKLLDLLVNQVSVPLCRERLYRCVICEIKKIILGF